MTVRLKLNILTKSESNQSLSEGDYFLFMFLCGLCDTNHYDNDNCHYNTINTNYHPLYP